MIINQVFCLIADFHWNAKEATFNWTPQLTLIYFRLSNCISYSKSPAARIYPLLVFQGRSQHEARVAIAPTDFGFAPRLVLPRSRP